MTNTTPRRPGEEDRKSLLRIKSSTLFTITDFHVILVINVSTMRSFAQP